MIGLRENFKNVDNANITYHLFFGIKSTFQCIKIQKTNLVVLACDGIAHIDEDHLEITPLFFDAMVDLDNIHDRLARIVHHMLAFHVIYIKRTSASKETLVEFNQDPVINFVIQYCNKTPLICLDNYIINDRQSSFHRKSYSLSEGSMASRPKTRRKSIVHHEKHAPPPCNIICCFRP